MRRRKIRKFADRQSENREQTENSSKTEATLSPVDRRGTRANNVPFEIRILRYWIIFHS